MEKIFVLGSEIKKNSKHSFYFWNKLWLSLTFLKIFITILYILKDRGSYDYSWHRSRACNLGVWRN